MRETAAKGRAWRLAHGGCESLGLATGETLLLLVLLCSSARLSTLSNTYFQKPFIFALKITFFSHARGPSCILLYAPLSRSLFSASNVWSFSSTFLFRVLFLLAPALVLRSRPYRSTFA